MFRFNRCFSDAFNYCLVLVLCCDLFTIRTVNARYFVVNGWTPTDHRTPVDTMVDVTNNVALLVLECHNANNLNNIAFSPYGLTSVLIALNEGVSGESALQIHRTARFPYDKDVMRVGFRDIHRLLRSYFVPQEGFLAGLSLSNDNLTLTPEYKSVLQFYGYDLQTKNISIETSTEASETPTPPGATVAETTTVEVPAETTTVEVSAETTTVEVPAETTTVEVPAETTTVEIPAATTMTPEPPAETEPPTTVPPEPETTAPPEPDAPTEMVETTTAAEVVSSPEAMISEKIETQSEAAMTMASEMPTEMPTTVIPDVTETIAETTVEDVTEPMTAEITEMVTEAEMPAETTVPVKVTTPEETTTVVAEVTTLEAVTTADMTTVAIAAETMVPDMPVEAVETTEMAVTEVTEMPIDTTTETVAETPPQEMSTVETEMASTPPNEVETTTVISMETIPPETATVATEITSRPSEETEPATTPVVSMEMVPPEMSIVETEPATSATSTETVEMSTVEAEMTSMADETTTESRTEPLTEPTTASNSPEVLDVDLSDRLESASVENTKDPNKTNEIESLSLEDLETASKPPKRKRRSLSDYIIARYYDGRNYFTFQEPIATSVPPLQPPYKPQYPFLVNGVKEQFRVNYTEYDAVLPFTYIPTVRALALRFPLDSDKYYLLIILPLNPQGVNNLICDIRKYDNLRNIVSSLKDTYVRAIIPSFMLKGFVFLTNTLQRLGIRNVFEPAHADFSMMTADDNIYVTNIEQAVTVTIRNYMEATPLSNTMKKRLYYNYRPVEFKVTHPFMYFIMDSTLDVALMAGKVVNPLNSRIQ